MVNGDQAHMPWMISKINEALYGIHSAHKAASLEAITHLYRVPGSEHNDIIVGFFAHAPGRLVVVQLLRSMAVRATAHSLLSARAQGTRYSGS
jgi:hypothetical protein